MGADGVGSGAAGAGQAQAEGQEGGRAGGRAGGRKSNGEEARRRLEPRWSLKLRWGVPGDDQFIDAHAVEVGYLDAEIAHLDGVAG